MKAKFTYILTVLLFPAMASAANNDHLDSASHLGLPSVSLGAGLTGIVGTLSFIAAVVSTLFLVIGGIRYIISNGNPAQINGARQTIVYAIAGLVVSILAGALVSFVLGRGTQ